MALKVVPAGDERCDIHTQRKPARYICESCLREFGVEAGQAPAQRRSRSPRVRIRRARRRLRRWRTRPRRVIAVAGGAVGAIVALILIVSAITGGSDGNATAPRTETGVVTALGLLPSPGGTGWITDDGACWVVSIQFGKHVRPGAIGGGLIEATNDDQTVGAAVTQNDFSMSETACAQRISAALRAKF